MIDVSKNIVTRAQNPIKLTFKNINQTVEVVSEGNDGFEKGKTYQKKIIKDCNGYAMPGQTLYIMGASGAGKTSLLNILSERVTSSTKTKVEGDIIVNDKIKLDDSNFGKLAGYVMQDDILYEYFTPREALNFAADLKLAHLSKEERNTRVEQLIETLGLKNAANTLIGSVLQKTISGGERKRTAIGVELITNPSLILLDEPTSGLDSFKALQIVKLLKNLSRKGKTVISTIH